MCISTESLFLWLELGEHHVVSTDVDVTHSLLTWEKHLEISPGLLSITHAFDSSEPSGNIPTSPGVQQQLLTWHKTSWRFPQLFLWICTGVGVRQVWVGSQSTGAKTCTGSRVFIPRLPESNHSVFELGELFNFAKCGLCNILVGEPARRSFCD